MKKRPTTLMHSLCGVLLACALVTTAQAAVKSTKVDAPTITLKRGSTSIAPAPLDMVECEARKAALIALDGVTKTTGSGVYDCIYTQRTRIGFGPNPLVSTCTAPKPAQQAQVAQCPSPTVGTWSQTKDYTAAPYPTCWVEGNWTPATAPAGVCATPPLMVLACPEAGANGRILESSTIIWPNCPTAALKVPSRTLVVGVNTGAMPHYWRAASGLTTEKVATQTGALFAWTAANTINWGTPAPPLLGTATLSWTPPTQNTDGTTLTNLAGYRIVYSTSSSALGDPADVLTKQLQVAGNVSSYVIEGLTAGTWYFAVKSFNSSGAESVLSNVASKRFE